MRLWHKSFIKCLPREQLVAQWRELSAIAGNLNTKGTPNHILVNKILDYPRSHFVSYAFYVRQEMTRRGYRTMESVWEKILSVCGGAFELVDFESLFSDWHNFQYLRQCYYNLEEKYDCGGVSLEYFQPLREFYELKLEDLQLEKLRGD